MWSCKYQKENMSLIYFKCNEKPALKKSINGMTPFFV